MNYKNVFWVILLCCVAAFVQAQTAVFVSSSAANDNGNGLSWATAKKTLAAGIAAAGNDGTVYVKAGEYVLSAQLIIPTGVSVKGGYSLTSSGTDTTKRDLPGTNSRWENVSLCTIITGGGNHRIATVNGLLEGCVVRRGVTTGQGGGVLIDGGTVRYCVIRECDAINESTMAAEGGGVYIFNGGTLTNSVVTECRADNGPAVAGGNGSLVNNTITRNWPVHCGTVADYDGNVYSTVVIGQQCWTKQNLRTTHYNDGTAIPKGNSNSSTEPRYYSNHLLTPTMLVNYGYLYNWPAVMHGAPSSNSNPSGVTGICPPGWHVPSDAEWTEMTDFVNSIARYRCNSYDGQIGKALSSKSGWATSSAGCQVGNDLASNNATMFTAFPAGVYNNIDGGFVQFGSNAKYWSATENEAGSAWFREMIYTSETVTRSSAVEYAGRSVRCVKQMGNTVPIVHTNPIPNVNIQSTQATCGGTCVDGGAEITAYGVCWSTSPNPTLSDSHTTDGSGVAAFTSVITGLTNGVTYYVRAYAVNSLGVGYGEERVFTTDDCGDPLNLTDYDGNQYNSVRIGTQCWMKENLRTTHYADGSAVPYSANYVYDPFYCYPNNNQDNVAVYGCLYNWAAVMHGASSSDANPSGVQGICPNGWHVPSNAEWTQLSDYVRSQSEYLCGEYIGKSLAATAGWYTSTNNTCAIGNTPQNNNATGFSAMPAGYYDRSYNNYYSFTTYSYFSSTTGRVNYSNYNHYYYMAWDNSGLYQAYSYSYFAYSVRCLRNN